MQYSFQVSKSTIFTLCQDRSKMTISKSSRLCHHVFERRTNINCQSHYNFEGDPSNSTTWEVNKSSEGKMLSYWISFEMKRNWRSRTVQCLYTSSPYSGRTVTATESGYSPIEEALNNSFKKYNAGHPDNYNVFDVNNHYVIVRDVSGDNNENYINCVVNNSKQKIRITISTKKISTKTTESRIVANLRLISHQRPTSTKNEYDDNFNS